MVLKGKPLSIQCPGMGLGKDFVRVAAVAIMPCRYEVVHCATPFSSLQKGSFFAAAAAEVYNKNPLNVYFSFVSCKNV